MAAKLESFAMQLKEISDMAEKQNESFEMLKKIVDDLHVSMIKNDLNCKSEITKLHDFSFNKYCHESMNKNDVNCGSEIVDAHEKKFGIIFDKDFYSELQCSLKSELQTIIDESCEMVRLQRTEYVNDIPEISRNHLIMERVKKCYLVLSSNIKTTTNQMLLDIFITKTEEILKNYLGLVEKNLLHLTKEAAYIYDDAMDAIIDQLLNDRYLTETVSEHLNKLTNGTEDINHFISSNKHQYDIRMEGEGDDENLFVTVEIKDLLQQRPISSDQTDSPNFLSDEEYKIPVHKNGKTMLNNDSEQNLTLCSNVQDTKNQEQSMYTLDIDKSFASSSMFAPALSTLQELIDTCVCKGSVNLVLHTVLSAENEEALLYFIRNMEFTLMFPDNGDISVHYSIMVGLLQQLAFSDLNVEPEIKYRYMENVVKALNNTGPVSENFLKVLSNVKNKLSDFLRTAPSTVYNNQIQNLIDVVESIISFSTEIQNEQSEDISVISTTEFC